jgi:hypothetical protein
MVSPVKARVLISLINIRSRDHAPCAMPFAQLSAEGHLALLRKTQKSRLNKVKEIYL